ncbi:hypothetical protein ACSFA7_22630 [Variovorax sp. LT1R20]|uniref:hypothetical protein n=1 Tax=Variovorax sp. LT1R20 TaxID=3443729 RepID=UPI003F446BEE
MTLTIKLRARQRDLLYRHRGFSQYEEQDIVQFDREVLEVLADSVVARATPTSEFQQLANQAVERAIAANALPSRPKKRPKERILDDAKKRSAVSKFLEGRKEGGTVEEVAAAVGEQVRGKNGKSVDAKTIQRWVKKAGIEARAPSPETASVTPEQVASDMGINPGLPTPDTPWVLQVIEHGPANRPIGASVSDLSKAPWLTRNEEADL